MSYKTVWKLCCYEGEQLVSAIAYKEDSQALYNIGEVTKPKIGLLFAFKTKEDAINGKYQVGQGTVLVKCKAKTSRRKVPKTIGFFEDRLDYWKMVFKRDTDRFRIYGRAMPDGTVFCTEVIPIEIVS